MHRLAPQVRAYVEEGFERVRSRFEPGTPDDVVWQSVLVLGGRNGEGPLGDPAGLPFRPTSLAVSSWTRVDLSITAQLPSLCRVNLWDCTGVDLAQLGPCPELQRIELYRSVVTTLEPIAHRPWKRLAIWGCPLERRWYDWLRQQWADGVQGEKPNTFPESTWRLARKLYEAGFTELVTFVSDRGEDRISIAGNGADDAGFAQLPEDEVDRLLARHAGLTSAEMLAVLRARFHELVPQVRLAPRGSV